MGEQMGGEKQSSMMMIAARKRGRPKGSKNRKKNTNQSYSDSD